MYLGAQVIFFIIMVGITASYQYADANCALDSNGPILLTNWLIGQFILDFLFILRESAIIYTFKKCLDPKRVELYISFFQVFVLWSLTLGWAIFGAINYNNPQWNDCQDIHVANLQKVTGIYIWLDFAVVFFCSMILPKVCCALCSIVKRKCARRLSKYQ